VDVSFDLPVLYEDADLLVVDKPAALATHGAPGDRGPSVAAWFIARYPEQARSFDAERPGIVHRLDKDTTGVLVLAKTPAAATSLGAAFEARTTKKTYLAVVDGVPSRERAVIDAAVGRHPGDRTRMAVVKQGRDARTEYETLGHDRERSFLVLRPETGRTHQIRVHLAAIGCPVANDSVYGRRHGPGEGRQLLHAWQLSVPHPAGGTLTATAPLPADMRLAVRAMGLDSLASKYSEVVPAELAPAD
jgi:23S rRNA pseudouridine1911/1915/1917 synthase